MNRHRIISLCAGLLALALSAIGVRAAFGSATAAATGPAASVPPVASGESAKSVDRRSRNRSGIEGPAYSKIVESLKALDRDTAWATSYQYGYSTLGQPLMGVVIRDPKAKRSERDSKQGRSVLITGATHGNEYLNLVDRFPSWFVANRAATPGLKTFLSRGGRIIVVPIVNPDGYKLIQRNNSNDTDLNRDFDLVDLNEKYFAEIETKQLAAFVEQQTLQQRAPLLLSMDYHCCDGSLLYPWSFSPQPIAAQMIRRHEKIAELMQTHVDPSYRYGPTGAILGYYARGTAKDYYFAKYGALAFTFEGKSGEESRRFAAHTKWWDAIFQDLAKHPVELPRSIPTAH